MADRSDQEVAFNDVAHALADYLEAIGWHAIVIGAPRVEPVAGHGDVHECVFRFTGSKTKERTAS